MGYGRFAETVLFGESLQDKLADPVSFLRKTVQDFGQDASLEETLRDDSVAAEDVLENLRLREKLLKEPGRPAHLRLDNWESSKKVAFPQLHELDDPMQRGRVLHFFANHELLALELMALVLLKFPMLPKAFQRTLVQTMAEEQNHLKLYLQKMADFGVEFGEIPINDFFWRVLSPVESPGQFLAGMSLTFEQANLDYALVFRDAFLRVGDLRCAEIMTEVYRDEIGHVRTGLAWSRRWGVSNETDWERYLRLLPPAISPLRAKGTVFSFEARRLVGFDQDYILRLKTLGGSKGRPPVVWFFCVSSEIEAALARAKSFGGQKMGSEEKRGSQHSEIVSQVEWDLSPLMGFVASSEDCVVSDNAPSLNTRVLLAECGFQLPEFVSMSSVPSLASRKLGGVSLWADSKPLRNQVAELLDSCATGLNSDRCVAEGSARFGSKCDSPRILEEALLGLEPDAEKSRTLKDWIDLESLSPLVLEGTKCLGRLGVWMEKGLFPFVLKSEHSSSGRERWVCKVSGEVPKALAWAEKRLQKGERLRAEPWFQRVADLSVQLEIDGAERTLRVVGRGRFLAGAEGQYRGALLGRQWEGLSQNTLKVLGGTGGRSGIWEVVESCAKAISVALSNRGFSGPAGIDLFVYKDRNTGELRLHPCVEINPRWTQGRVALALQKRVLPQSCSIWLQIPVAKFGDPVALLEKLQKSFGLQLRSGKLLECGAVATTNPDTAKGIWTAIVAAPTWREWQERARNADPVFSNWVASFVNEPPDSSVS